MSKDSILAEVLAENLELRKLLSKDNPINIESLSTFQITEELANKLKISGVLIAEGVWNGVKYTWDEIKNMYNKHKDKLANLKLKVEHEKTKEYKDKEIGKHTNVELNDTIKAILYEGEITDPKAIKDIKEGKFRATSLKSEMRKVSLNGEEKGEDINPIDNSLTEYPACEFSKVFTIQELSEENNDIEYFGIQEYEEDLNNKKDIEEIEEEDDMKEYIEIEKGDVLVLPEDIEELTDEEEIEFEIMPEEEAKKKGRYYYYPRKKKYPKRIKRRKGYYYYPGEYPVPYYYWYYYPSYSKAHIEEELDIEYEVEEELAEYKIVFNKKTKKYIVFKATGKEGFGAWKIVKQFDSKEEAKKFIAGKGKTKEEDSLWEEEESKWTACIGKQRKAGKSFKEAVTICKKELKLSIEEEQEKDEHGCVIGEEKWDEDKKKCIKIEGEYKEKEGEKMSEELAKKGPITCPVDSKEFKTFKEFKEHWAEKHEEKYGAYKKAKKLTKKLLKDKEFRKRMKKHYLSLEKLEEEKEEAKEEKIEEEEKEEKKETKEEEKKEEIKEVPKTPKEILQVMKQEEMITPDIAAELLLQAEKKEE